MTQRNHEAIVVDATTEEAGGCPVAHERAPQSASGGRQPSAVPTTGSSPKILAKNRPAAARPRRGVRLRGGVPSGLTWPRCQQDIDRGELTASQDWWPADIGDYGPFMIRKAWHGAGTYRISDGRGGAGAGQQPCDPAQQKNPETTATMDKAQPAAVAREERSTARPCPAPTGRSLTGNVTLEVDGLHHLRLQRRPRGHLEVQGERVPRPRVGHLARSRALPPATGELEEAARRRADGSDLLQPGEPERKPRRPIAAARDIRDDRSCRMAMNDEETVALIAGGHTFGKTHGAGPADHVGARTPRPPPSRSRAWAGGTPTAPARARTPSPRASRSPGPPRPPSGATTSSRTSSATSGS
ncbi:Catalase-peroxidase [Streptomyces antimycoticus]